MSSEQLTPQDSISPDVRLQAEIAALALVDVFKHGLKNPDGSQTFTETDGTKFTRDKVNLQDSTHGKVITEDRDGIKTTRDLDHKIIRVERPDNMVVEMSPSGIFIRKSDGTTLLEESNGDITQTKGQQRTIWHHDGTIESFNGNNKTIWHADKTIEVVTKDEQKIWHPDKTIETNNKDGKIVQCANGTVNKFDTEGNPIPAPPADTSKPEEPPPPPPPLPREEAKQRIADIDTDYKNGKITEDERGLRTAEVATLLIPGAMKDLDNGKITESELCRLMEKALNSLNSNAQNLPSPSGAEGATTPGQNGSAIPSPDTTRTSPSDTSSQNTPQDPTQLLSPSTPSNSVPKPRREASRYA